MLPPNLSQELTKSQRDFLENFFSKCKPDFFQNIMLKSYPANHLLIDTADSCTYVYILLSGRLQAIEEQVAYEPYFFTELSSIEIVGDFELFTSTPTRAVTLTTMEPSLFLIIPSTAYLTWIKQDSHALFIRIQMLIRQFMFQGQTERYNLFQNNKTRLLHLVFRECQKQSDNFPVRIPYTRSSISCRIGCSVRTVNRTISSLEEENIITLIRGKMHITKEQFEQICKLLSESSLSFSHTHTQI